MSEQKKTVRPISQAFLSPNTRGPWRDSLPCGCVVVLERMTLGVFVQGIEQCPLHAAAPDLFVACERVANDTTHPIMGDIQAQLRAAIANAKRRE